MQSVKRRVWVLAATAAAASMLSWNAASATEVVKIGVVMPFSGPAASYGMEARQAAELALKEVNQQGGKKFELVFEDDKGTPQGAVGATQKQIAMNKVQVVVGGMGSQLALAQSAVAKNRVLYVNTAAQADAITEQGNRWLFQINNTSSMNASNFHKYIVHSLKPKTIAFVGENTEFSKPLLEMLKKDLQAANIQLVNVSMYDVETNDFTSLITKVKALNPDLVYMADGAPARLVQFWKQARQLGGFKQEAVVSGVVTPVVLKAAQGSMDGIITGDIYSRQLDSDEKKSFVESFQKAYGAEPGKNHLVVYEGIKVVASAINQANTATDFDKIAATLRDNTWTTPRGTLKFDAKGRAHAPFFYIQKINGMNLDPLDTSAL